MSDPLSPGWAQERNRRTEIARRASERGLPALHACCEPDRLLQWLCRHAPEIAEDAPWDPTPEDTQALWDDVARALESPQ